MPADNGFELNDGQVSLPIELWYNVKPMLAEPATKIHIWSVGVGKNGQEASKK